MDGYTATQVVHTEEGAALAPGEVTGKEFDPKAEHNAALIEAGLLRPSESPSEPEKGSDGGSAKKADTKA